MNDEPNVEVIEIVALRPKKLPNTTIMDTLFPLPPRGETKLERLKREHRIYTHYAKHMTEAPWSALLVPKEKKMSEAVEYIGEYCRVLEESGRLVTGSSEADAVFKLCQNAGIPCVL